MKDRCIRTFTLVLACLLAGCAKDRIHTMVVSIPSQKLALYTKGELTKVYDVSTSRFCVSCSQGSNGTPLGKHEIAEKIGDGQPLGMKFKSRRATGEIVEPNAPGRDPIVTRILWLTGIEAQNRNSHGRCIYIHGTPEEWRIGTPASFGCVRMRSRDVRDLFNRVGEGAIVDIENSPLELPAPEPTPSPQIAQVAQPTAH